MSAPGFPRSVSLQPSPWAGAAPRLLLRRGSAPTAAPRARHLLALFIDVYGGAAPQLLDGRLPGVGNGGYRRHLGTSVTIGHRRGRRLRRTRASAELTDGQLATFSCGHGPRRHLLPAHRQRRRRCRLGRDSSRATQDPLLARVVAGRGFYLTSLRRRLRRRRAGNVRLGSPPGCRATSSARSRSASAPGSRSSRTRAGRVVVHRRSRPAGGGIYFGDYPASSIIGVGAASERPPRCR